MATFTVPTVGSLTENIAKIDARFLAMLQGLNVEETVMARMAELGVINTTTLHTLVDDRKGLRAFLLDACGIDPRPAAAGGGWKHTVEAGKIVSAWEASSKRVEVETKRDAERLASNLPPQLTGEEVLLLKQQFEAAFNRTRAITKAQCPSKAYLELKVGLGGALRLGDCPGAVEGCLELLLQQ